jgi:hypothetical protein
MQLIACNNACWVVDIINKNILFILILHSYAGLVRFVIAHSLVIDPLNMMIVIYLKTALESR